MIDLLIADTTCLVREGIKRIEENSNKFKIVGEVKSNSELWNKLNFLNPSVVIIDHENEKIIDVDGITKIKKLYPEINILIISNNSEKQNILKVIKHGALGYLTKECQKEEVLAAIDTVSKGEKFFCGKVLDIILEKNYEIKNKEGSNSLTEREIEIIKLIAEGNSNQDLADKLFLSIHTVYTHRKNIMKKLKLKSPVELVLYALNSGIVKS